MQQTTICEQPTQSPTERRECLQGELDALKAKLSGLTAQSAEKSKESQSRRAAIDSKVEDSTLGTAVYKSEDHADALSAWRECLDIVDRLQTSSRILQREIERVQASLEETEMTSLEETMIRHADEADAILGSIEANRKELIAMLQALEAAKDAHNGAFREYARLYRAAGNTRELGQHRLPNPAANFPVKVQSLHNELDREIFGHRHGRIGFQELHPAEYRKAR